MSLADAPSFWDRVADLAPQRMLVIAPHPDDEVFALGGTLVEAAARGWELAVAAVTDGEHSHPHTRRLSPTNLRATRLAEIEESYRTLGIAPARVRWGLPDAGVTCGELLPRLEALLPDFGVVLAPLGEDGHPDHDACGLATKRAALRAGVPSFAFAVWAYSRGALPPEHRACVVGLSEATRRAKHAATRVFRSQLAAIGPDAGDGPVLPAGFLEPFDRPFEVLYS